MTATATKIPALRFPEFEGEWEEKRLGEVFDFYQTNSFSRSLLSYEKGNVKNIHYGDIHTKFRTSFDVSKEDVPFIDESVDISRIADANYCKVGDLIIADASEDYKDVGKAIEVVNLAGYKLLAGLHTLIVRDVKNQTVTGFKGYMMQIRSIRLQVMRMATGISVLGISKGNLAKIVLLLPSLPEQQKIATFLTTIDTHIQQLSRKKALLEQYKKGVMQQIFSQEIRFKDEEGKEFPAWEEKRLGEIGKFIGGGTPSTGNTSYWNGSIPWISSSDLSEHSIYKINATRFISTEAISESATKLIPKTSILIVSRVGVGKVAITDRELCTSQDFTNLKLDNDKHIFIAYLLKRKILNLLSVNQGTSIKGFLKSDLEMLSIDLPSISEQQKIAAFLSTIDRQINLVGQQLELMQAFKKGLLQQMFV